MHHFVAIGEFKLELQSGNTLFGSNLTIFRAVWPCNLTQGCQPPKYFLYFVEKISVSLITFPYPLICSSSDSKQSFWQLPIYSGGTHWLPLETLVDSFGTTGVAFWDCPRSQIVHTAIAHARNKVLEFEFVGGNLRMRIRVLRLPPFWTCTKLIAIDSFNDFD